MTNWITWASFGLLVFGVVKEFDRTFLGTIGAVLVIGVLASVLRHDLNAKDKASAAARAEEAERIKARSGDRA